MARSSPTFEPDVVLGQMVLRNAFSIMPTSGGDRPKYLVICHDPNFQPELRRIIDRFAERLGGTIEPGDHRQSCVLTITPSGTRRQQLEAYPLVATSLFLNLYRAHYSWTTQRMINVIFSPGRRPAAHKIGTRRKR